LLREQRRALHARIAETLENQFADIIENQPEVLAYHYTEAGLNEQAVGYWHKAGQKAMQRSAHVEAIGHFTKGLEVLNTLPTTPARTQKELSLCIALGAPQIATKGYAAPEVERVYSRARELCKEAGSTPQLFPTLFGLWMFYNVRGELRTARDLGEELLIIAQRAQNSDFLLEAYSALGISHFWLGETLSAQEYLDQGIALYDTQQHRSHALLYGIDPGVGCLTYAAWSLWLLGYPDRSIEMSQRALTLASEIGHPFSQARALSWAAMLHQFRREKQAVRQRAQEAFELSNKLGFPMWLAQSSILRGRVAAEMGEEKEGIAQMRQGLSAYTATGATVPCTYCFALMAEPYGNLGKMDEGFSALAEAMTAVEERGERWWESEIHRLKGELLLKLPVPDVQQASFCFQQALNVAHRQRARSLELRAATSLARLWQNPDKRQDAYDLLAPVYGWFTEGFDTADLKDAKALLDEMA
jgi:predicted ATPase